MESNLFPASQNRVVRVLEQRIGKRIAAANNGRIRLDSAAFDRKDKHEHKLQS